MAAAQSSSAGGPRRPPNPAALRAKKVLTKFKGKNKEREDDEQIMDGGICVGLWRTVTSAGGDDGRDSGPSVSSALWEVDLLGKKIIGLCWDADGKRVIIVGLMIADTSGVPTHSRHHPLPTHPNRLERSIRPATVPIQASSYLSP